MIGVRRFFYEGDPDRAPVHEQQIHMVDGVRGDPPPLLFNLVEEEVRCPADHVWDGGRCVEWRPLSTDPVCTGLDRVATEYDTPDPERYARCRARAAALCDRYDADPVYCACFRGDRRAAGTACHAASLEYTFLPDFAAADLSGAAGHPAAADVAAPPPCPNGVLIAAYVVLGVAVVGAIALMAAHLRR